MDRVFDLEDARSLPVVPMLIFVSKGWLITCSIVHIPPIHRLHSISTKAKIEERLTINARLQFV